MGEKWFEFVKRIKKEGNHESLKDAMREASQRKNEWRKDGASPMKVSISKKTKKVRKSKKSKKSRKSKKKGRKSKKSKKSKK